MASQKEFFAPYVKLLKKNISATAANLFSKKTSRTLHQPWGYFWAGLNTGTALW